MGKWRDEHLRIEGDAVTRPAEALHRRLGARTRRVSRQPPPHRAARHPAAAADPARVGRRGPLAATIAEAFAAAIVRAQRRVRISHLLPAARHAARRPRLAARGGVRVQVMIPTCSDSPFTDLISDSRRGPARRRSRTLPYDNGFLHAKLLIVDDDTASVGTANMDYRSLLDNLEVTAFIRDRKVVREMSDTFDGDLASCRRIVRGEWPAAWRRTLVMCCGSCVTLM